jgi:iron complex outermembrane recepter protein
LQPIYGVIRFTFFIFNMNFLKPIFAFCFLFCCLSANAQTFTGIVKSVENKMPLTNISIQIPELHLSANSDLNGVFVFENLPKNSFKIQISGVGLETLIQNIDTKTKLTDTFYLAESHIDLHEIVVSVPSGQLSTENIVNIESQKIAALKTNAPLSLMEALANVKGVEQITTGVGIGKPVIRGLSGSRIVTYAQGIRVENQQFGDEHGLGINDVGIESVEVIKGPASLLYGADALGGVIYFTEEKYAALNKIQGSVGSRYMTNTNGLQTNAGLKMNKNNLKFNIFGAYNTHNDYTVGKVATTEKQVLNTRFDEAALKTALGYGYKNWIGNLRYSYLQNNFGLSEGDSLHNSNDRKPQMPNQNIVHQAISLENNFYFSKGKLNTILGFSTNERKEFEAHNPNYSGHTQGATERATLNMTLQTLSYNIKYSQPLRSNLALTAGVQGMIQTNTNKGLEVLIPDVATNDAGAYGVLNYTLRKNWELQGGLRYDMRNLSSKTYQSETQSFTALERSFSNLNGSFGSVYKVKKLTLRGNISTAFRAPNSAELLSNGAHGGALRYEIGDANLKSEQGVQADLSAVYESTHFSFAVNPFYNIIQNFIYLSPTDSLVEGVKVYHYRQTNANLYGGEATAHLHPHNLHWLHLQTNFASVIAADANKRALAMIPANHLTSNIKVELDKKGSAWCQNIFLEHVYRFSQQRIADYELATPDYHLFNFGINIRYETAKTTLSFDTGIKNIFNTNYTDHLSRFRAIGTPNIGRNIFVGLNYKF